MSNREYEISLEKQNEQLQERLDIAIKEAETAASLAAIKAAIDVWESVAHYINSGTPKAGLEVISRQNIKSLTEYMEEHF